MEQKGNFGFDSLKVYPRDKSYEIDEHFFI